ncbi:MULTISPECIES: hypothetical protein [unclassified Plantactinospora]|uniref:hypothetical protein n=1 Tax=unclassified Plantactinospora TaxID=2631981 RepID=UPI000D151639|nr:MULTISPECIES: hypothetical protein [unclassified Plantactinospora]AVT31313.1 hypothetical protein C6361_19560 [Plantactinospora sp. BC1]AVT39845.1 hypothetical protein C6W10_29165 [Plantactinospora sp. BB1]
MAVVHAFALPLALLAIACLPVAIAALICADELIEGFARWLTGQRDSRRSRRAIERLDRAFEVDAPSSEVDLTELDRVDHPAIERIAADLRRLGDQRLHIAGRSRLWQDAVLEAYDDRLRLASRCLGVAEHLGDLDGIDLEIERVRVEGELQAAGLILPSPHAGPRQGGS